MSWQTENIDKRKHCFFGSAGGVSQGIYASLNTNLSSRDNKENIYQNFDIITAHFNMKRSDLFTMRQSITNKAVIAENPSWFVEVADGAVTDNPNILLGIKTADCAPVLLADYQNGVIGAAHAGWRGACGGIIENVVALMEQLGAERQNIAAAIGPCMQQKSFQIREDMRAVFLAQSPDNAKYFKPETAETYLFDLSGYVRDRLRYSGVENIENSGIDTCSTPDYFSYRRNTRSGLIKYDKDYPTQYSCIRL